MDCWFEDKIQSGKEWSAGLRTGYFFFCEIPLRGKYGLRHTWWIVGLRIVFQNKKTDESKVIALSGQVWLAPYLVDRWFEDKIQSGEE